MEPDWPAVKSLHGYQCTLLAVIAQPEKEENKQKHDNRTKKLIAN